MKVMIHDNIGKQNILQIETSPLVSSPYSELCQCRGQAYIGGGASTWNNFVMQGAHQCASK